MQAQDLEESFACLTMRLPHGCMEHGGLIRSGCLAKFDGHGLLRFHSQPAVSIPNCCLGYRLAIGGHAAYMHTCAAAQSTLTKPFPCRKAG